MRSTFKFNIIYLVERIVIIFIIFFIFRNLLNLILIYFPPGNEIELPRGTHTYPFTCALPPTVPSSFEGEFGHVRYTIKVTLDRPWKFDQDMKMAFTVISPVDLNLNPTVKVNQGLSLIFK